MKWCPYLLPEPAKDRPELSWGEGPGHLGHRAEEGLTLRTLKGVKIKQLTNKHVGKCKINTENLKNRREFSRNKEGNRRLN